MAKSVVDTLVESMESVQRANTVNHLLRSSGHEPAGHPGAVWKLWRSAVDILEDCGTITYHRCGNIFIIDMAHTFIRWVVASASIAIFEDFSSFLGVQF